MTKYQEQEWKEASIKEAYSRILEELIHEKKKSKS